ncbi:uncharacterized protein LOC101848762 [Aplysia californica]|uniref:Uncharacterized protein LOC101848762 n=1 Tax=Aplysia californica TaxID=6500 RepID=A0ABM1VWL4_APLCA|nr:uncharacterized protein LOC101848762 [Aplysia californica]
MEKGILLLVAALVGPWTAQGAPTTPATKNVCPIRQYITTSQSLTFSFFILFPQACGTNPADIHFLLDASGSVQPANFQKQLDFVKKFTRSFNIGPNGVQIGATIFSTTPANQFWMNSHPDKTGLLAAINKIPYPGGNTHTELGLKFIRNNAFTKAHGDRDRVANILIVITDGQSTEPAKTKIEADEIHKENINIFAIGVGNGVDRKELELIASDPKNVFTVSNFNALDNIQASLQKTACEVDGHWSKWGFYSPCSKTCGGGTQFRERTCTDPAPANGGKNCQGELSSDFAFHGNGRQDRACNTAACTTLPPPTTKPTIKPQLMTTPAAGCGVQPADILFVVDASGSVTAPNFQKTLTFVENTVNGLKIGPADTQIGMVTFDTKPYLQFHFNKFSDKQSIINRVKATTYTKGGTNTDKALKYATDTSFTTANGMRPNAAHIAIVVTDGQSQSAAATAAEAKRLRDKGITVFSIGVGGGAKQSELNAIASDPDKDHVFVVTNFDSLNQIKGSLQQKACEVKPTMKAATPPPATCGGQADIVFLLDESGSVGQSNFDKMLSFVQNVANDFTIGPNDVQVGVDTFSTSFGTDFHLKDHLSKPSLLSAVKNIHYSGGGTNTGDAIGHMTRESFTAAAGHRANVPKIAIVVTDGRSNNKQATIAEAEKARKAGITMLAIGVGAGVDDSELNAIATDPDSQNVYKASSFDALKGLQGYIATKACGAAKPQPSQNPPPNQKTCGSQADIVFLLDSSGSVGNSNFKLLLNFVNTLVQDLDIGQNKIRVGVEKFSSRPYNEFNLNKYNDKTSLQNAISNIKFQRGGTNTGDAITYLDQNMFKQSNGDRPGVPNIAVIVTDGRSNKPDETKAAAKLARDHGINVFSVGVGKGISKTELNEMATDPDNSHVLMVDDFSKLSAIKGAFQQQTCQAIPPTLPPYIPTQAPKMTPAPDPCKDQINDCNKYGADSCTNYKDWAQKNCQLTCGFCTTSVPTIPPPCVDKLPDCPNYDVTSCVGTYKSWAMDNCRKYCGYCAPSAQTGGYFNKCFYKGKQYSQGDKWDDGCAYQCECTDASTGKYDCYNKCPTYYNLPTKCTLVQKQGQCCLEPVCNFDATYTTKTGQNVSDLNGNKVCVYGGSKYYQSQVWTVGCDLECICEDAGVGLYNCQSKCAHYGNLPSYCKLVKPPGECCEKPHCEFSTQVGTFTGKGNPSGPGVNGMMTTPPPCIDKNPDCKTYQSGLCTDMNYRPFAMDNCRKFCGFCNQTGVPSPNDVCVYKGQAYKQGDAWYDGCDKICVCDNAAFGYFRCDDRCPKYLNLPSGCTLQDVPGQCCKGLQCNTPGTFTGSQTVPNTMGAVPQPYPAPNPRPAGSQYPTPAPGQTYAPYPYLTPAPGQTYAPGKYPTLAPGQTYPPGIYPYPPLVPGQTLAPGQKPIPTLQPGQTWAPGKNPYATLVPGQNPYPTPAPGQTYAPYPYLTPAPGQTYAPGKYPTLAPGQTYPPGIYPYPPLVPGQTLAPGQKPIPTLQPGQTWAPGKNPYAPLVPGQNNPGPTKYPFPTPAPGQTYAPYPYLTPAPGQTYAPGKYPTLAPGKTYPPGIYPYPPPVPGQTLAPGQKPIPTLQPGQTWAPGKNPYATLAPGQTYAPGQYPFPTLAPGQTYAPGQNPYPTLAPGQTYAPGRNPYPTLAPGQTYAPGQAPFPTPAPGQTYAPGQAPFPTLAPGQSPNPNGGQVVIPPKLDGCVYNGVLYQQGQRWSDGCKSTCVCENGKTGQYRCSPRCPTFQSLDPRCTLKDNPNDVCCKFPDCPTQPNGQVINVVPTYGQGSTGYSPAQVPTGTGGTMTGSGGLPVNVLPSGSSAPMTGTRTGCVYKGTLYTQGAKWKDGCDFNCECLDGTTGNYRCTDICPNLSNLPPQCVLIPDPNNACCQTYKCDFTKTTQAPVPINQGGTAAPPPGTSTCVYNGRYYRQGEEWTDGCALRCRCEDAMNNVHQCTNRCPDYNNVPISCTRVPDPKDPQCCKIPDCGAVTGTSGGGTTTGLSPVGFSGTITGYGKPPDRNSITGFRNGCLFKGVVYNQGDTWEDGCDYDCECTDASAGKYVCNERCQRFGSVPSGCSLGPDPNDRCCQQVSCVPTAGQAATSAPNTGPCQDKLKDCYLYGKASCTGQYAAWAKDNCQLFCGFCGTNTQTKCEDKIPNCVDYGTDSCKGDYTSWAEFNCPKTCGLCGGTATSNPINVGGVTNPPSGGISPGKTKNEQNKENVKSLFISLNIIYLSIYCSLSARPLTSVCLHNHLAISLFFSFSEQLIAAGGSSGGNTGFNQGSFTIDPNSGVVTGVGAAGCYYKNKLYQQGDDWQDGCLYNCTCENAVTGFYKCVDRCPTYNFLPQGCSLVKKPGQCCSEPQCVGAGGQITSTVGVIVDIINAVARCIQWNLPSVCTLKAPAPGKCCKTPDCPSNVNIQYPPGYVEQ